MSEFHSFVCRLHFVVHLSVDRGFPCGSDSKEPACNAGDLDSIPRLGRSPGEGIGYPLQNSGLEKFMGLQSWTRLSEVYEGSGEVGKDITEKNGNSDHSTVADLEGPL